jgi:hypothetical protein
MPAWNTGQAWVGLSIGGEPVKLETAYGYGNTFATGV